jgi:hypothetical protein
MQRFGILVITHLLRPTRSLKPPQAALLVNFWIGEALPPATIHIILVIFFIIYV